MRAPLSTIALLLAGCGAGGGAAVDLPQVYPPVRAATPSALVDDPSFQGGDRRLAQALDDATSLAQAVKDRLYTPGPTEILRIVHALDDRTAGLDPDPTTHPCLAAAPVPFSYELPGTSVSVELQCLERFDGGFVGFGFHGAPPIATDSDFFIVEGQDGGMGGAYRLQPATGRVDGWLTVADSRAPQQSQVVMHVATDQASGIVELQLAGSGVGFCSAHVKTDGAHLFVQARTNAPPPPGAPEGSQGCDALRAGCFAVDALDQDLGADAAACRDISAASFAFTGTLDASDAPDANVTPSTIYRYFADEPAGVAAF